MKYVIALEPMRSIRAGRLEQRRPAACIDVRVSLTAERG
jgi:hypothetical protein